VEHAELGRYTSGEEADGRGGHCYPDGPGEDEDASDKEPGYW